MKKLLSFLLALAIIICCISMVSFASNGVFYGDVNNDNAINKKDDLALKKHLAGYDEGINEEAANVFYDDTINKKDQLRLKQYLAGHEVILGPETIINPDGSFDLPSDNT